MPSPAHEAFIGLLRRERAIAIVRASRPEVAARAMEAAVRGGFCLVEFTMNTPGAVDLVRDFAGREGLCAGAGTVLDLASVRAAVDAGARFLVSPVIDEELMAEAGRLGVPMIPGGSTPTELLRAYRLGAPAQKLFPAPAGGPAFVRALLGPMPFLRIIPTSGIDAGNIAEYLRAGVIAVGLGSALFDAEDLRLEAYDRIQDRAGALREVIATAMPDDSGSSVRR